MARLAFGGFELDPVSGELWRGGTCIRMQEQPFRLLLCLLEHPGQLVSREELRARMWSDAVHVDFEDGLNAAAWRLRQVLEDSAEKPAFIETVPRKGYRFVGKVLPVPGNPPLPSGSFPMPIQRPASGPGSPIHRAGSPGFRWARWRNLAVAAGLLAAMGGGWLLTRRRTVAVEITPLVNLTGDPAVDYFASALSRQVGQDLQSGWGMAVVFQPGSSPGAGRPPGRGAGTRLRWTLHREDDGYRIQAEMADQGGRTLARTEFRVPPDGLHEVHRSVADFVAKEAKGAGGSCGSGAQV